MYTLQAQGISREKAEGSGGVRKMIVYKLLDNGGFVAGDTETRLTCYAYPSSVYAVTAKRNSEKIAGEMIRDEMWRNGKVVRTGHCLSTEYDVQNWKRLER
jgi:hypothetical protein